MSAVAKRVHSPEKEDHSEIKQKMSAKSVDTVTSQTFDDRHMFSNFVVDKILGENSQQKIVFVQGHYKDSDVPAVVILERTPFSNETVNSILEGKCETAANLKNDIYHTFSLVPPKIHSGTDDLRIFSPIIYICVCVDTFSVGRYLNLNCSV